MRVNTEDSSWYWFGERRQPQWTPSLQQFQQQQKHLFLSPIYSLGGDSTIQGYQRVELLHCSAVHRMSLSSAWIHAWKKTCAKGRNWKDEKKSMGLPSCSADYTLVIELQPAGMCLQGNGCRHNGNTAVGKGRAMLYHSPGSGLMFHWMKIPSFQIAKSWNSAANFKAPFLDPTSQSNSLENFIGST